MYIYPLKIKNIVLYCIVDYRLNRILSGTLKASASQVFKVRAWDE